MKSATIKKLGGASIALWVLLFAAVFVLKTVPTFSHSSVAKSFSLLGNFVHAEDGGGADGGNGGGGADGGGSDGANDAGAGSADSGGNNGGSNDANGSGAAAGGDCGGCGGSPDSTGPSAPVDTGGSVGSDNATPPVLAYVPPPQKLNPPTNLNAVCDGSTITVSWSAPGSSYSALRIDDVTNGWTGTCDSVNPGDVCGNTNSPWSGPGTPGHTYQWWVHAVDSNGVGSEATYGANFSCPLPPPPPVTNTPPKGFLDSADCTAISGWVKDADTPNKSVTIHLYKDGPYGAGGIAISEYIANVQRSDVGSHAFYILTPEIFKDGKSHTIYVYGIDSTGGSNPLLEGSPKQITCTPPTPKVCPTGTTGTYPNCVVPTPVCPAGTTGTYPNCVVPTPSCPSGTTGTYPNCVVPTPACPTGTTGTYPDCRVPQTTCPVGTTGIYPNCVVPTPACPSGTTGTYPDCKVPAPVCPAGTSGTYPNCVTPTPVCPSGTTGTYPNCVVPTPTCPSGTTGTYPDCKVPAPVCPAGTSGTYPVCTTPSPVCPSGTSGTYPNCVVPTPACPAGTTGTYPNCVVPAPVCPSGTAGAYPNCVVPTPVCPSGTTGTYPNCVVPTPVCPLGTTGVYPNCVVPQPVCPSGMTGTYPNCVPPYVPPPVFINPMCTLTVSSSVINYGQSVGVSWSTRDTNAGWIENIGSVSMYGSVQMTPAYSTTYVGHFTGTNGQQIVCSAQVTVNPPVVVIPPHVPYVTLSQVPYTGLDLGKFGTTMYFGLLAVWLAFMAYLVLVKKLHHDLASYLSRTVFKA